MMERLQKFLAETGLGSRRACEDLIRAGRVSIDGVVASLGSSVDPDTQIVTIDGRPVARERKEYWLLNKPAGVLSAAIDPRGRPTVVDRVPAHVRVFPVGRLDLQSTGLLVLTNDGELAARLLHPRYHVEKEYRVTVLGSVRWHALEHLRRGVVLDDGPAAAATVELLKTERSKQGTVNSTLRVVLKEGRKRQVRRMFEAVGHRVVALHRNRFDGLTDSNLPVGQARPLSQAEIDRLFRSAGT